MQKSNIIVVIGQNYNPICFGNFKKACNDLKLPYHSLKFKKFPIQHGEITIYKEKLIQLKVGKREVKS